MRTVYLELLLLAPLLACEPPAASNAPPAPARLEETKISGISGVRTAPAGCLARCGEGRSLTTDLTACRRHCEAARRLVATPEAADGGLEGAMNCLSACHEGGERGATTGCTRSCVGEALTMVNAPAEETLERMGECVADCYEDRRLKPTDRETCKLTCMQVASMAGPGDIRPVGR